MMFNSTDRYIIVSIHCHLCSGKIELLNSCMAEGQLELKIGAPVILLKTISIAHGLTNGARGIVRGFTKQGGWVIVYFSEQEPRVIVKPEEWTVRVGNHLVASRTQIPLCLAWAISIHKSQGMSLAAAVLNLSKVFEYGQAYVALSRVKSIEGIYLTERLDASQIRAHPKVNQTNAHVIMRILGACLLSIPGNLVDYFKLDLVSTPEVGVNHF